MLDLLKLLIFFILFIILSESFGLFILKKLNVNINIIALPIGMASFGCVYELIVLPVQFFYLDSAFLKYALFIAIIICLLFSYKEIKSCFSKLSKRNIILFIVFAIIFFIKFIDLQVYSINQDVGDNFYYIPLINIMSRDGVSINGIGSWLDFSINGGAHAFYGQMNFLSCISNILAVDSLVTINTVQIWYQIIFYITNIYNIIYCCHNLKIIKHINKYISIIFIFICVLPTLINSENICVDTINVMFIIAPLIFYLNDNNKGWLRIFQIFSLYSTTVRSTYIFLIAFFLLPYFLYLLINNRFEIKENIDVINPTLFSLILYLSYNKNLIALIIGLVILILINVLLPIIYKKIGHKYITFLYLLVIAGLFLFFSFKSINIGNVVSTWDNITIYEELKNEFFNFSNISASINSIICLTYLLLGIIIFFVHIFVNKRLSYLGTHVTVDTILCINPLVAPYLSVFLRQVYGRLFWQWINPLFFLLVIDEFIELIKKSQLKNIFCICTNIFIMCLTLLSTSQLVPNVVDTISYYKNNKNNISLLYKIGQDSYEVGKILEDYSETQDDTYIKVAMPPKIINSTFIGNKIRFSNIMGTYRSIKRFAETYSFSHIYKEDQYEYPIYFYLSDPYRYFNDWIFENDYDNMPDLKSMLKEADVDVFIVSKWKDGEDTGYHFNEYLHSFAYLYYETDSYQVFVINS